MATIFKKGDEMKAKFYYEDGKIGTEFVDVLSNAISAKSGVVYVCVGTDRSTGDSYGPLIGSLLTEKNLDGVSIYGTLENTVHAQNLDKILEKVILNHPDDLIVGIDAGLGLVSSIGYISIDNKPLLPGAGVRKKLASVGDYTIMGVVNVKQEDKDLEHMLLGCTRLYLVMEMAKVTVEMIEKAHFAKQSGEPGLNNRKGLIS